MTDKSFYLVQANSGLGTQYVLIDGSQGVSFVESRKEASVFSSKALAMGWLLKAKSIYINYRFAVVNL